MGRSFWAAMLLSTLAGMSTMLGSLLALFSRRRSTRTLSFALGFSAGVMVLVSFTELLPEAKESMGGAPATLALLLGLLIAFCTDLLVPPAAEADAPGAAGNAAGLSRVGAVTAVALTLHNFPEGIATFMAGYADFRMGLPIALAVALHNIPEGIAVSVPIYYGTGRRGRAFGISALSGLSEPLGALCAWLVLAPFLNKTTLGAVFGAVAGIMIYLSFDELLPASRSYGHGGMATLGAALGVAAMWLVLSVF